MISLWLLLLVPLLLTIVVHTADRLQLGRNWRHERCLRNTERLERELFPQWFADAPAELEHRPGAVWQVDDPGAVGYISPSAPPAAQRWGVEHGMMYESERVAAYKAALAARGMLYSGEAAEMEQAVDYLLHHAQPLMILPPPEET